MINSMNTSRKIKVLVVDDSAVARNILVNGLRKFRFIDVVGSAADPYIAKDKIIQLLPDVLTLDVEMPRMDGLTFLKKIMEHRPMPVIMVSSLTKRGGDLTVSCLGAGAIDFITKPEIDVSDGIEMMLSSLAEKIKFASKVRVKKFGTSENKMCPVKPVASCAMIETTNKIIAIGASTGGTEAIKHVLERLPADSPGIVITQHMPEKFTKSFAERLNKLCHIEVREAVNGDSVIPGLALLSPGNYHLQLKRSGARYFVETQQSQQVNGHRPSVDVMFESVAKYAGSNAVGVILTGMGADGAKGLLAMRENGARTIAQDEESCVVFGMPKEAILLNAAESISPIGNIADEIFKLLRKGNLIEVGT
ncbi:MAG: chemotaxis response regulator protein-glutamate methylesterase [Nitrospira sp.]|nr:chemotaxis response regulator protein-glutamate methylesterase [Nitrospira sp.]